MAATFPRGRFVWHELMSTDLARASAFYSKVVGWKTQAYEHDPNYRLWMMGKRMAGGLMRLTEDARRMGAPPQWYPYIAVPDVDQSVRQAEAMGARAHVGPRDIPAGRFAVLADPWGATFGVYKPSGNEPVADQVLAGDFAWHEHTSDDWKKAWDFYSKLFGWEHTESMEMGPGATYWMFKTPGASQSVGGMYNRTPDKKAPPHWLSYIQVSSADTAAATAGRAGGRVVNGPMDVPGGGRVAMMIDPEGAAFAVHSQAAATARPSRASRPKRAVKRKPARKVKAKARARSRTKRPRRSTRRRR